jgi:hypothetical protein
MKTPLSLSFTSIWLSVIITIHLVATQLLVVWIFIIVTIQLILPAHSGAWHIF